MSREEQMYDHVRSWQKSGLNKSQYAKQHEIDYQRMHYWCRKYADQDTVGAAGFLALSVEQNTTAVETDVASKPEVRMVITIASEIRIEVH